MNIFGNLIATEFREGLELFWKWILVWCECGETRTESPFLISNLEIAVSVFKAAGVASMLYLAEHLEVLGVEKVRQRINQVHHLGLSWTHLWVFV